MIPVARPYLTKKEADAASRVILSGWVTQGPKVLEFEQKFARYVGSKYAVAVSNCTTALHLALIVSGIGQGDEVICPSLSFIATANAIWHSGAKPVFGEVDPRTYNLDPKSVEKLITKKTKGILVVHQVGLPADIDSFKKLCKKYHLKLIEDAACAIGSSYHGKKIGSHSDLVCFSFHPRKLITTGDGGMIATSNFKYFKRLKLLRQHGMSTNDLKRHLSKKIINEKYLEIGYNYRMTDVQAAIGIEQMNKLQMFLEERKKIAEIYNNAFGKIEALRIPSEPKKCQTNYQSYILYLTKKCKIKRDDLMQKLLDEGISVRHGVMTAHTEKAYISKFGKTKLPISEDLSRRSIILPLYYGLKSREVIKIIKIIKKLI